MWAFGLRRPAREHLGTAPWPYSRLAGMAVSDTNRHTIGMAAGDVTTIKVSKTLRDRITASAVERDQTVQGFMEKILDDYDRNQRLAAVATAMSKSAEEREAWRLETDSWAAADDDLGG